MTEQTALHIATAFLDAFAGKDLDKAGSYLADDFVFDGPIAHYKSAADFLAGSEAFVKLLQPRWTKTAAFGDENSALLLYDLFMPSGNAMRIADHYTVSNGKIQTETILWDTYGSPFRQPAATR
jgi:ketosteroid isomerase-like protein